MGSEGCALCGGRGERFCYGCNHDVCPECDFYDWVALGRACFRHRVEEHTEPPPEDAP
jgi:hypothetical protein